MTGAVRRRSPAPLAPISSVPGAEPGTEGGVASLTVRVTEPLVAAAASALADAGFEHSVAAAISALHQQLPTCCFVASSITGECSSARTRATFAATCIG